MVPFHCYSEEKSRFCFICKFRLVGKEILQYYQMHSFHCKRKYIFFNSLEKNNHCIGECVFARSCTCACVHMCACVYVLGASSSVGDDDWMTFCLSNGICIVNCFLSFLFTLIPHSFENTWINEILSNFSIRYFGIMSLVSIVKLRKYNVQCETVSFFKQFSLNVKPACQLKEKCAWNIWPYRDYFAKFCHWYIYPIVIIF